MPQSAWPGPSSQGLTWPAPAFLSAGYDLRLRYEGASSQLPKPTNDFSYVGDAIPSGLVSDGHVYAYFSDFTPGDGGSHPIEVARARDDGNDPLTFWKYDAANGWSIPASTRDGEVMSAGSSLITFPAGFDCGEEGVQEVDLHGRLFVMTMECDNKATVEPGYTPQGAWFYATTRNLNRQRWSAVAVMSNAQQYIDCSSGKFDGYYPSFVSPTLPPAHLGSWGYVLYLNGILTGSHSLAVRHFQISAGTPAPFQPLPNIPCNP